MKKILLFVFGFLAIVQLQAQNGVAISTSSSSTPDASAILDVQSTTQGMLIPRVDITDLSTAAPVTAVPATSLMVYNTNATTGPGFYHWDGTAWISTGAKELNDLSDAKTSSGPNESLYLGRSAGFNATGTSNTAVGSGSLVHLATGNKNIALGYIAGNAVQSGDLNILIGYGVEPSNVAGSSNELNIGDLIYGTNVYNATGNIGIGNGNNAPDASAVLDIASTTGGLLIPRMTQAQRNAINSSNPTTGLMVYQSDNTPGFYYYDGIAWVSATGAKSIDELTDGVASNSTLGLGLNAGNNGAGAFNVAIGLNALKVGTGSENVAVGTNAGIVLTTGIQNTFVGSHAAVLAAGGSGNIGVGKEVLNILTSGDNNIMLGLGGGAITTGDENIVIGRFSSSDPTVVADGTADGQLNIGQTIHATGMYTSSVKVGIGNDNNAPTSTLDVDGSVSKPIIETTSTANYPLDETDYTVIYKHASGNPTMTLPDANTCEGRIYIIRTTNNDSGDRITINAASGDGIFGKTSSTASIEVGNGGLFSATTWSVTLQSAGGTTWYVIAATVE